MYQRNRRKTISSLARHKRFSPLMLVGMSVPVVLALIASAVFILPRLGSRAAAAPVVPQLPANGIVALWFGFNGNNLTLQDTNGSLRQGRCMNGVNGSIFGQFAYCNAPSFFRTANRDMQAGLLKVPQLGMSNDGKPCPSVRDFGVVDMDQSDNVVTTYLVMANGQTAQATTTNRNTLQTAQAQVNGSDNRLLAVAQQATPIARVPVGDPMVLTNNQPDINKLNAYRRGVDQIPVPTLAAASTTTYCKHLLAIGPARIQLDMQLTQGQPSPDPAAANSLFTFLAQRFVASYGANGLNCVGLLNVPDPVAVTTDANGVAITATSNAGNTTTQNPNTNPATGAGTTPAATPTTPTMPTTSPTANPTTGATPTPTAPATDPTITPTTGIGN